MQVTRSAGLCTAQTPAPLPSSASLRFSRNSRASARPAARTNMAPNDRVLVSFDVDVSVCAQWLLFTLPASTGCSSDSSAFQTPFISSLSKTPLAGHTHPLSWSVRQQAAQGRVRSGLQGHLWPGHPHRCDVSGLQVASDLVLITAMCSARRDQLSRASELRISLP